MEAAGVREGQAEHDRPVDDACKLNSSLRKPSRAFGTCSGISHAKKKQRCFKISSDTVSYVSIERQTTVLLISGHILRNYDYSSKRGFNATHN